MNAALSELSGPLSRAFDTVGRVIQQHRPGLRLERLGQVTRVEAGIVHIAGLDRVRSDELIQLADGRLGLAFKIDRLDTGLVMLDESADLSAGSTGRRTGRVLRVPVGGKLLGRVVDPRGRPRDDGGPVRAEGDLPAERPAPGITDRAPVTVPLVTGLKVVDALIPVGRGQRELILGDRQTGKTAIAVDTIINQKDHQLACIYCAVGKRASAVARVIAELEKHRAVEHTVVVVATEDDPPGLQFVAPYAAMSMGEHFMRQGKDALVVFDDLTRHARAYREISLLLRRPPGREAYPGDIFYIHARLLERSTHLKDELGGGSLTALPIIETQSQNISAYIPTNLISITDGQIFLSPDLFQKGILPAVDVGRSVSRVGGKTQLKAYRAVAGDLRLSYSQFEELESFARFSTRMDEDTRKTLEHGRRVREVLKQPQYRPLAVFDQIAVLVAANQGLFDGIPVEAVGRAAGVVQETASQEFGELAGRVEAGKELENHDIEKMQRAFQQALRREDFGSGEDKEEGEEEHGDAREPE